MFLTVGLFSCPYSCLAASYDDGAAPMLVQPAVVVYDDGAAPKLLQPAVVVATTTQALIGSPVVYTGL